VAPDHFAFNFAIFAGGCAAALAWLRTGMIVRGALLLVVLFVAADVAMVARFVLGDPGGWFFAGLFAMQVGALAAILWWAVRLAVRRWSKDRRARRQLFAAGLQHYLRNEHPQAEALFRRLHRVDPWDVPAAIGLANVLWRRGQCRRARRLLRAARRLDRDSAYSEFIAEQLRRVGPGEAG
jgi:hypothetical protein